MKKAISYKKESLKGRVLRFLGMSRSVVEPSSCQEITHVPIPADSCYSYQKQINAAFLEAEHKKAEAMEWQRRRVVC